MHHDAAVRAGGRCMAKSELGSSVENLSVIRLVDQSEPRIVERRIVLRRARQLLDIVGADRGGDEARQLYLSVARIPRAEYQRSRRDLGEPGGVATLLVLRERLAQGRPERRIAHDRVGGAVAGVEQVDGLVAGLD